MRACVIGMVLGMAACSGGQGSGKGGSGELSAGWLEDESAGSEAMAVLLTDMPGGCEAASDLISAWNEVDEEARCNGLMALSELEGAGPHRYTLFSFRPSGQSVEGSYTPQGTSLGEEQFGGMSAEFDLSDDPCNPVTSFTDGAGLSGTLTIDSFDGEVLSGELVLDEGLGGEFEATPCSFPFTF